VEGGMLRQEPRDVHPPGLCDGPDPDAHV
jgi:hypothetical protein